MVREHTDGTLTGKPYVGRHIGIIGLGSEGSAACYRQIANRAAEIEEPSERPLITLHSQPTSCYMEALDRGAWETVADMIRLSAEACADAGADFCVLPDNTAHHALPMVEVDAPLPILNMVDLVADAVDAAGCKTIGLIGTSYVTGGSTYQAALGVRGITLLVPHEEDSTELDEIIFREALLGRVRPESVHRVERAMERLMKRGCEALILGYSESSMMLDVGMAVYRLFDPVELLADAAVARAGNMQLA